MSLLGELCIYILFKSYALFTAIGSLLIIPFVPLIPSQQKRFLKMCNLPRVNLEGKGDLGIHIHNKRKVYRRLLFEGTYHMLNSHVNEDITINNQFELAKYVCEQRSNHKILHPLTWTLKYFNLQSMKRSFQVGENHYDLGNNMYEMMLDKHMQYSCAYWRRAKDLEQAQIDKMRLVGDKLKLKPGMRVLDLGCGWGTLSHFLAKEYGVSVVGCTVSVEQKKYTEKKHEGLGLPVEIRVCDYRKLNEKFDRVVSVGMLEHVGSNNHREFFRVVNRCLKDEGISLVHTIGVADKRVPGVDIWFHEHLYPNTEIPYFTDIANAMDGLFIMEDWHNMGYDYYLTLVEWEKRFDAAWSQLKDQYDDKFYRVWKIYLQTMQAYFYTRGWQLWQIVITKNGHKEGYESVR